MKHIVKILSLLVAISAFWIGLLQAAIVPRTHTWLVSQNRQLCLPLLVLLDLLILGSSSDLVMLLLQLPIYFVVSLGCYGLLMVGIGLMQFPTCPQEAVLLQQVTFYARLLICQIRSCSFGSIIFTIWSCRILQRPRTSSSTKGVKFISD